MARARIIAFSIGEIASGIQEYCYDVKFIIFFEIFFITGMLLLENAVSSFASSTDMTTAKRWIKKMTNIRKELNDKDSVDSSNSYDMVFDGYPNITSKL